MIRHAGPSAAPLAPWFKSRHCRAGTHCVEIRFLRTVVQVRDSKQISAITGQNVSRIITLPTDDWRQFLRDVAEDDLATSTSGPLHRATTDEGNVILRCESTGVELVYDLDEWDAFCAGVLDGDFEPPTRVS